MSFAATVPKVTYRELQAVLERMDTAFGAAEAHGLLCGALCARAGYGVPEWLFELTQEAAGAAPDVPPPAALEALYQGTLESLNSPEFAFAPLLPGDDEALTGRVSALAAWCGGFLFGIGTAAAGAAVMQHGHVGEFLADLTDISRAELEPGRTADAGEGDYAELYEFVRAGTQLAWEELAALRVPAPGAGAAVH